MSAHPQIEMPDLRIVRLTVEIDAALFPAPSSMALLGLGLGAHGFRRWIRK